MSVPWAVPATGVRAIRLDEGDEVIAMATCEEGGYLLTVTENGQGRRTPLGEYRTQNRGGRGVRNYDCIGKETLVAGVRVVGEEDDVILIADDGIIIRIPCEQIAVQSRYGGGVHAHASGGGAAASLPWPAPPARRTPKKPMGKRPPSHRKQVMKM